MASLIPLGITQPMRNPLSKTTLVPNSFLIDLFSTEAIRLAKCFALIIIALMSKSSSGTETKSFTVSGWREVLVSVSNLNRHQRFLKQIAGWENRYSGSLDKRQIEAWALEDSVSATEDLWANEGDKSGFIRLVKFENVSQDRIRPNDQAWDTGGIFDFNVRVKDLDKKFQEMQSRGWWGYSNPHAFKFGKFHVTEWIAREADGMAVALIQRHLPKLEGWPNLREFSRTFNSTQIVSNMEESRRFYMDILGFKKYLYAKSKSSEDGQNVLGLPLNLAKSNEREIWILHPEGSNEGSVELLSFDGVIGRDFASKAKPPNLGIFMLRFPVKGIDSLARHLATHNIYTDIITVSMPPYGQVKRFTIQSPNGSWLEFFEELN